jgi:Tfp pilus assembly protein PilO
MRLFIPISFIIISIILLFVVVNPFYKDVSSLRSSVESYNIALDNSTNLQKTQDSLIETYKNISKEDKDKLAHFLPNTVNNINFILEIEQIANNNNIQVKNIKFDTKDLDSKDTTVAKNADSAKKKTSSNYGTFPVEFSIDTTYPMFLKFLKDLESNLRLIDVQSISFKTTETSNKVNDGVLNFNLRVQTYWLK